ncbi:MAG: GAF domain-containing protein [Anaerolineae bacterium]|nr:GAF domain-containing protein [Anaerolineae bacterium]
MRDRLDPCLIFDLLSELLVVADTDSYHIRFANDALLHLTGYTHDQLTQLTLLDLYPALSAVTSIQALCQPTAHALQLTGTGGFQYEVSARFGCREIQDTPCIVCAATLTADIQTLTDKLHNHYTIYRALLAGIFDLFFRIKRDGTYVEFKIPSKKGLYEPQTVDEIIGRNVAEVVPPHVTKIVMPVIERVIQTGQPESVEYQIAEETEQHFYEASFARSLPDEIVAVVRDVTDLKRNEAVLRHQRDLSAKLGDDISLDDALGLVLDTALAITGMDCGGIYLVDHSQDGALCLLEQRGLSEVFIKRASFYPPDAAQTQIIMRGDPIYNDYPDLPVPPHDIGLQEHLRAFIMVPIRHRKEIIGCINLASRNFTCDAIHDATRDALEAIAFYSGSAIVRMRTQEKLRESEEIARTLLNAPHDTAILVDRNHTILAINEAGARRFGTSVDALLGQCAIDNMPAPIQAEQLIYAERVFSTGQSYTFDDDYTDGLHFSTTLYPLFDGKGNVAQLAVFAHDVTLEKRAQEALEKKETLLAIVAQAANRLLAADDLTVAIHEALKLVGKTVKATSSYVFRSHVHPVSGEPAISQVYFWTELGTAYAERLRDLHDLQWQVAGLENWYDALRAKEIVVGSLPDFPQAAQVVMKEFDVKSLLLLPIFIEQDEFWGFIGFDDGRTDRQWLSDEISVLELMASSVAAAIKRHYVEENLRHEREIADTLREVGMVLTSTLELEKVLQLILEQAKRVVPYDSANIMLIKNDVARIKVGMGYEQMGFGWDSIKGITFPLKKSPIFQIMVATADPYVCPDVDEDEKWIYRAESAWVKSWLGAPIVLRGKVVGFFSLDSQVSHFYNANHLKLIQPFAKQAAIAFENASLFAESQSLERIKSEMIRIASHDLRKPLMRLQKAVTSFKQNGHTAFTAQQFQIHEQIADAVFDMEQIISNILSVERIEAQHQSAQTLDWPSLIQQSLKMVQADVIDRQHTLTVDCSDALPDTHGDPVQLQQAVVNLLGNAIKFTPPGGKIAVRVYPKPYGFAQTVAVEVEDNGIGIPPDQQRDLYKPYYRARQSKEIDGTGLGLSIVKAAIEHHQGHVYFKSAPGKGSMFGFWIPASS